MKTIEKEIEELQEKIEKTNEPMTKSYLLLKKIGLLKIVEARKKLTCKGIVEQLEWDLKNENIFNSKIHTIEAEDL